MSDFLKLSELPLHTSATVIALEQYNALSSRLSQLGVTEGASITPLFKSLFGDPTAYRVKNSVIALRAQDCEGVTVRIAEESNE